MKSLETISRRPLLIGGALSLTLLPHNSLAATVPAGLKKLLERFRKCPGIVAEFEEEKNIVLLAAPLKSSGTVYFHPPHSLARVVEKPQSSHLVITDKRIVVKEDGARREVDLSDKPALRGLISSLMHILSGNEKKLTEDYETNYASAGAQSWRLELVPRSAELKRLVNSFHFAGTGLKLRELRVKEASGDETITRFTSVNTEKKFSKAEIERIFEI